MYVWIIQEVERDLNDARKNNEGLNNIVTEKIQENYELNNKVRILEESFQSLQEDYRYIY